MSEAPPSLAYCKSALLLSATAELRPTRQERCEALRKKAPKRDGCHGSPCPVLATHLTSRARTRMIREMAMKRKLIPGAIVLLLVSWFALDAVAAILV
jgi:hypothetical protein